MIVVMYSIDRTSTLQLFPVRTTCWCSRWFAEQYG